VRVKRRQVLIEEVGRATQAYQRATDGFDDIVGRRLGLNPTDLRCLDWLTQSVMTAGELSQAIGLSTAATTTLLDRLEGKGYIERRRDDTDRRKVVVALTAQGQKQLFDLYGPLAEEGGPLLERFSNDELARLLEFLIDATEIVNRHKAQIKT
jgi:DNA-binding MarR family transcriptional regulator